MEAILMRNPYSGARFGSRFCICPGSSVHTKYSARFDGVRISVAPAGVVDTQSLIEAWGPYTDINFMLSRLKVGDSSVLSVSAPLYGDFAGLPSNPADAINLVRDAEQKFLSLDVETRKGFNNDFRFWLASLFGDQSTKSGDQSTESSLKVGETDES